MQGRRRAGCGRKKEGKRDRGPGTRSLLPRTARFPGRQSISCFVSLDVECAIAQEKAELRRLAARLKDLVVARRLHGKRAAGGLAGEAGLGQNRLARNE